MKSIEYDLRYIQAAMEVLEKYLLSEDVFWPIGINPPEGEPDYPSLTLDGVLLARKRLEAHQVVDDQKVQVERVISDLELIRSKWRVAWEKKASQCHRVRSRMWADFLQEYQDNPHENADRYAYEVRLRVMLQLTKTEIGLQSTAEVDLLASLDRYIKSLLIHDGFIWETEIQAGFPPDEFWYLYGKLPHSARRL